MKGYVLINVRVGAISAVLSNLRKVAAVKTAEMTFGEYDVIAVLEAPDIKNVATIVSREIQTIPDVTHTVTCLAVDVD